MIIVLGSTGMLGSAVGKYFLKEYGEDNVMLSFRDKSLSYGKLSFHYDPIHNSPLPLETGDVVLNCIGTIKPFMKQDPEAARFINAVYPWRLSRQCDEIGASLIHITTDCVFSGNLGYYNENSAHDCLDDYGKSKSLGEPYNCMVIRTSIIGEEIHKNASLIEWAKSQKGKDISGFTNHLWNGITTTEYARVCDLIIKDKLYEEGLFHVFGETVNKYELLSMINDRFELGLNIRPVEATPPINRVLTTMKPLNKKLGILPLREQLQNM